MKGQQNLRSTMLTELLKFANKTQDDIILAEEFNTLLGKNFINILSDEKVDGYAHGQITEGILKAHINDSTKNVYICGPPPMMDAIEIQLANLKIDEKQIIKEVF
jgi:ferredoxin-NADP reductase